MLRRFGALLALAFVFSFSGDADAAKKKKKPPATKTVKKEEKVAPPNAEQKKALGELMGSFQFGMSKDEIIAQLTKTIDERYAEQIKATSDVYQQDKLRKEKNKEVTRIKQSYTEFTGKKTGWDVSLIDEEFAHNTGEAMLVYWENQGGKNQRRFFFLYDGQLWKMFIAIDTKQLQDDQRNFGFFRGLMESRYGKGATAGGRVSWKVSKAKAIQEIRIANAPEKKDKDHMIEVIKEKEGDGKLNLDENKDAVDAIISGSK
jgi:hypothetical protein